MIPEDRVYMRSLHERQQAERICSACYIAPIAAVSPHPEVSACAILQGRTMSGKRDCFS